MAKNEFKKLIIEEEKPVEKQEAPKRIAPKKPKTKNRFVVAFQSTFDGSFLTNQGFIDRLPYLLFLCFLALMYISYSYYAEGNAYAIKKMKKEIKEYRFEYIATKSELMYQSKQSEIAKRVDTLGLKENKVPPYCIKKQIEE